MRIAPMADDGQAAAIEALSGAPWWASADADTKAKAVRLQVLIDQERWAHFKMIEAWGAREVKKFPRPSDPSWQHAFVMDDRVFVYDARRGGKDSKKSKRENSIAGFAHLGNALRHIFAGDLVEAGIALALAQKEGDRRTFADRWRGSSEAGARGAASRKTNDGGKRARIARRLEEHAQKVKAANPTLSERQIDLKLVGLERDAGGFSNIQKIRNAFGRTTKCGQ
jgi:hypothetical protein